MMKAIIGFAVLLVSGPALGGGVSRSAHDEQQVITATILGVAAASATPYGSRKTARAFTVSGVTAIVSSVSGGGAGNTVFRISDGTNSCDATLTCAVSQAAVGSKELVLSGACGLAPGTLTLVIQASGCTSTQPAIRTVTAVGR